MTGKTYHVDLPYRWTHDGGSQSECACADAKAYGIYVDTTDRGHDLEGNPVFRFWHTDFLRVQDFRNDLCRALGISLALNWQTVVRSEYTSDLPFTTLPYEDSSYA